MNWKYFKRRDYKKRIIRRVNCIRVAMPCPCSKNTIHLKSDSQILTEEKLLSQVVCVFCWCPLSTSRQSSIKIPPLVANCGHIMHLSCLQFKEEDIHDFPIRCPECGHIIRNTKILHFMNYRDDEDNKTEYQGNWRDNLA